MIHAFEMMPIGYFSVMEKSKTVRHCVRRNVSNVFHFSVVTRKLRFLDGMKGIINPYQKSQRLINELLNLYNCCEKDHLQVAFILQRICTINDLPDAN